MVTARGRADPSKRLCRRTLTVLNVTNADRVLFPDFDVRTMPSRFARLGDLHAELDDHRGALR